MSVGGISVTPRPLHSEVLRPVVLPSAGTKIVRVARVRTSSVVRFSLAACLTAYLIFIAAGITLWFAASAFGLRHHAENFVGDLISSPDFKFVGMPMLIGVVLTGAAFVVFGVVVGILGAKVYNVVAGMMGGVEVVLEDDRSERQI